MRRKHMDFEKEMMARAEWVKEVLAEAGADGVVLGLSGGKDSALAAIICRMATPNVVGIIMPCESKRNYSKDKNNALKLAEKFDIKTLEVDLTPVKQAFREVLKDLDESQTPMAYANINPRLRMITLYNYAQRKNYLVCGTGNRSEATMGYFTKWGDGAYDFNPIGDLVVRDIYKLLRYAECPEEIINEPPSAALFEGQTDEQEMGITYREIDDYILDGIAEEEVKNKIDRAFARSVHKRTLGRVYPR